MKMFKKIREKFFGGKIKKTLVICLLLTILCFMVINSPRLSKWSLLLRNNTDSDIVGHDFAKLENELFLLKQEVEQNKRQIDKLSLDLSKLQNQEPAKNINNVRILLTIFDITSKINEEKDFAQEYEFLATLTEGKSSIYEYVFKIKNHLGYYSKNIEEIYNKEYRLFIKDEKSVEKSKIRRFFDNNITIRKINNFDDDDNEMDIVLSDLSASIRAKNYDRALEIIDNNNIRDNFQNTREALLQRKELKDVIRSILHVIYNEYY
jgi:hypothetical protein